MFVPPPLWSETSRFRQTEKDRSRDVAVAFGRFISESDAGVRRGLRVIFPSVFVQSFLFVWSNGGAGRGGMEIGFVLVPAQHCPLLRLPI